MTGYAAVGIVVCAADDGDNNGGGDNDGDGDSGIGIDISTAGGDEARCIAG